MRVALWPDSHPQDIERFFAGELKDPLETLIAFDDRGAAIGFAEVSIRPYAEGCQSDRVAYLEGWYVEPEARRRGVGTALIRAAEDWARARGCVEFGSDTESGNELSAIAHRAAGFTEAGLIRCFRKAL